MKTKTVNGTEKVLSAFEASCPSCGGAMVYSPERKKLYCDNCQTCKEIEFVKISKKNEWEERKRHNIKKDTKNEQTEALKCPNCGASVVLNSLEYSKKCPYCDSSLVSQTASENNLTPDAILPFTFSYQEACSKYREGIKKKWFVPNKFKKSPPVENIKGVYIPAFGFDADTSSTYVGQLARDHTTRDSNGNTRTYTTYQNISGLKNLSHRDVLVETSSKIMQDELEAIKPFNMTNAVIYNQGFIMGYTVETYNQIIDECKKTADGLFDDSIKTAILSGYSYDRVVYLNVNTKQSNIKYLYHLLPIYKCDYLYKKKHYTTLMNGQTGKVGKGYPLSPVKITFFTLFIIAIVIGLLYLFFIND